MIPIRRPSESIDILKAHFASAQPIGRTSTYSEEKCTAHARAHRQLLNPAHHKLAFMRLFAAERLTVSQPSTQRVSVPGGPRCAHFWHTSIDRNLYTRLIYP